MASNGVALALMRDVRSAAMQETALAAVGQPCEPSTKETVTSLSLPHASKLRTPPEASATELSLGPPPQPYEGSLDGPRETWRRVVLLASVLVS